MASDYVDYLRNWLGYGGDQNSMRTMPGDDQYFKNYYNYPGSNFSPAQPGTTMGIDPQINSPEHGLAVARALSAPGGPNSPAGMARGMVPMGNQAQIPPIPPIGPGRLITNPSQTMPSISDIPLLNALGQQGRGGISPNVFGRVDWNAPMPSFQPPRPQQRPYQPNYNQVPGQMGNSPGASSSILDLIGKVFGGGNQQQNSNYLNPYQYNPPMSNYD